MAAPYTHSTQTITSPLLKAGISQLREDTNRMTRSDAAYANAIGDLISRKQAHVTTSQQSILMMARHENGIYYGYGTSLSPGAVDAVRFPGTGNRLGG